MCDNVTATEYRDSDHACVKSKTDILSNVMVCQITSE